MLYIVMLTLLVRFGIQRTLQLMNIVVVGRLQKQLLMQATVCGIGHIVMLYQVRIIGTPLIQLQMNIVAGGKLRNRQ